MYLGIDLGTSNSAVVGNQGGELRLFKTVEGHDVLPSVLYVDRRGGQFVGLKAYDQALLAPENVARAFKRLMGTTTPLHLKASGKEITPEEASTEVLRTLLRQAKAEAGDFEIEGAIVTVPAAFNQMQSEATVRAAKAAGLERIGLLQEPIAAAMASLEKAANRDGQFLVYDLGGGTFDVALVQSIKGAVTILAHEGINQLGGTNFDTAIMNSIVLPWLKDRYDLGEGFQRDPAMKRMMAIARLKGEQAKIELSTRESATIFVSEDEARAADRSGEEIYIEATVTRRDLERLIGDQITETIKLCRKVLDDNGLTNDDIDRVVLIGGPSKMPIVRDLVPRELGIPADLNTDPMVAVARGAAIFAESRVWEGAVSQRKASRGSKQVGSSLKLRYDYEARTSGDEARIKLVVLEGSPAGCRVSVTTSDGRDLGTLDLESSPTIRVPLTKAGDLKVRVAVSDGDGALLEDASAELVITRVVASAAGIPATQTIAVKTRGGSSGLQRNQLTALLKKGTNLPASGVEKYRASKTIRYGSGDRLEVELFQQSEGVLEPELNLFIGSLSVDSDFLEENQVLREGHEVHIHWHVDDSGILTASASIPDLELHTVDKKIYVPDFGARNFDAETGRAFAEEALVAADRDLDRLEEDLGERAAGELVGLRRRMNKLYDDFGKCIDADGFRNISEDARFIRQDCSRVRHSPNFRRAALSAELERARKLLETVNLDPTDSRVVRLEQLARTTKQALADGKYEDAERAIEEVRTISYSILWEQPEFLAAQFLHLARLRHLAIDPREHERCTQDGQEALEQGDLDELHSVIGRMFKNLSLPQRPTGDLAALAHLAAL